MLIVVSVASQVQGLISGRGFIEDQQLFVAVVGGALIAASFALLLLAQPREPPRR